MAAVVATNQTILVVGGGVSGMTAALQAAECGKQVVLVEKSATLGGRTAILYRYFPKLCHPTGGLEINLRRLKGNRNVRALTLTEVTGISGTRGDFTVPMKRSPRYVNENCTACGACADAVSAEVPNPWNYGLDKLKAAYLPHAMAYPQRYVLDPSIIGTPEAEKAKPACKYGAIDLGMKDETLELKVGAIVWATGWQPYDAAKIQPYGYGRFPNVITSVEFERLADPHGPTGGKILRPSDGGEVKTVVFVQCAGQRDDTGKHLPYCSGHCCATSIKQAMYFKDANPAVDTVVLYTDLRVPGNGEDFYRSGQSKGVTFTKGKVAAVEPAGNSCTVRFRDLILDEDAMIENADLVVLATGQVPNSGVDIDKVAQNEPGEWQSDRNSVLNLAYRQGKDLPMLRHGFSDSHFICFPYETRRTGIYTAGPVRRPMDIVQAVEDATGAALKAIQAAENAELGRAAHPRSGDLSYPIVRLDGCTQCKRRTVECPFGAIDEDEKRYPVFNESCCRRCGTCMGACPVRVISLENYSVDTVGAQLKAVDVPDEFSEKPRILVLACENDAYPALDMAGMARRNYSAFVRIIPVRCLGSVNTICVSDALNSGYDGVMMMGCKHGDDYQCHFVKGSELAAHRMSKIDDTLKQMALETERVATYEVAITDIERVLRLIEEYAAKINEIGMSPLKGLRKRET